MFFRKRKNDRVALEEQIKRYEKRFKLDPEILERSRENRTLMFGAFASGSTGPGRGCQSLEDAKSYFRQCCVNDSDLKGD